MYLFWAGFLAGALVALAALMFWGRQVAKRRAEEVAAEEELEGPRLHIDAPLSQEQVSNLESQIGSRSVLGVIMHALEIRGFLYHAAKRGRTFFFEDEEGDHELDFHFDCDPDENNSLH